MTSKKAIIALVPLIICCCILLNNLVLLLLIQKYSATVNEVVDLRVEEDDIESYDHPHMAFCQHQPIIVTTSPDNQSAIPGEIHSAQPEAIITMHHTIQVTNLIVTYGRSISGAVEKKTACFRFV